MLWLQLSDHDDFDRTPRRSSLTSSSPPVHRKRCGSDRDPLVELGKKARRSVSQCQQVVECAPPPSPRAGPSHAPDVNIALPSAGPPSADAGVLRLRAVLCDLMDKLDRSSSASASTDVGADFSGFRESTGPEPEDGELIERQSASDPLEELDAFGSSQQADVGSDDDAVFLRALEDLQGHFHGQEEKGEPLFARLATILDASLRRRPSSEAVKSPCGKFLLPSYVSNLTVPTTTSAFVKVMNIGGKLFVARLCYTNGLLAKALVPVARCISDIGERSVHPVNHCLDGFNNSLCLLASAVCYINQLR